MAEPICPYQLHPVATVITTAVDEVAKVAANVATMMEPHPEKNRVCIAEKTDTSIKIATSMRNRRDKCIGDTAIWTVMMKKPVSSCTPI